MKKIFKQFLVSLLLTCLLVPSLALAQGGGLSGPDSDSSALNRLENLLGDEDNPSFDVDHTNENTFTQYIGLIISVILGLLGVIFTVLIVWAGYTWMTAQGNDEKVSKASKTIWTGIIGLLIVISAFAIWRFIFERIVAP